MIYGRAVVGGYGKFMKLKPRGLNNIYTATVNAFFVEHNKQQKNAKSWRRTIVSLSSTEIWYILKTMRVMEQIKLL